MGTTRKLEADVEQPASAYAMKISLLGSKPAIWRRFCVPADITFDRLHDVIQIVMGWEESHLHCFEINGRKFSESDEDMDVDWMEEAEFVLSDLVPRAGAKFLYEYDFGDGWEHELLVERIDEVPKGHGACIQCLDGKRACPPEDVGGIGGFEEYLSALENPKHPEHIEYREWRGPFDPKAFDLNAVNIEIAKYCRWSRPRAVSQELFAGHG